MAEPGERGNQVTASAILAPLGVMAPFAGEHINPALRIAPIAGECTNRAQTREIAKTCAWLPLKLGK